MNINNQGRVLPAILAGNSPEGGKGWELLLLLIPPDGRSFSLPYLPRPVYSGLECNRETALCPQVR